MQFAKDSFYMTLLARLEAIDPARTVTVNGTTRAALIVAENEVVVPVVPLPDCFYIEWGAAQPAQRQSGTRELMAMECVVSYHTFGTTATGVDRGRTLAKLDMELISMCQPPWTEKRDYTQTPSADLGTGVAWTQPVLGRVAGSDTLKNEGLPRGEEGVRLERPANLVVFFYPEAMYL